ncbi:PAS domain-containing sensor histidine kinase [Sphingomonas sp. CARO-RG-8B-R24-01]|uniref:PAS domain-containing sensor histidine kinase n=1 Tax=Sphingomonas sp. CARO-RG-8B-R24-01 TaxID=2914831 RepID=UPI001F56D7B2|nr:PAS domain-containing sensor histidine kinase [Sphingomonas sp. CARO-RG-8B-R24-01]
MNPKKTGSVELVLAAPAGTARELIEARDWGTTQVGPQRDWPDALRMALNLILNSPEKMFLAWGPELTFFFNDGYATILGNKLSRAMGAPMREIWSNVWDDIEPIVDKALAGEATRYEDFPLSMTRHGKPEETWWSFSYSPLYDAQNIVQGMFCVTSETTERVVSTADLHDLNATLETRIHERSSSLLKAEEQLRQSQKLEAIGQLTGGVAHDFNNLLTVIRGSVDILRRDGLTEEKRNRYIAAIGDTADRAAALTGQLLAFARRQALKPELFDAGDSLREVADMIRTLAGSRIALDIEMPEESCFIMADRSQFDTTLINLGINARDAMNGEGKLTMATGPVSGIPEIRSHAPVAGDFIAVTITDSGSGISEEVLGRIFEPFFTTKEIGKGTGLGLSQVIGFAKQSGGDIRVDTTSGEGTTFTLYLPRAYPENDSEQAQDDDDGPVDGEGMCVLLVEDNEQVGEFATQALKELGYDSIHAVNADRALEELAKDYSRFHVVFSDVVMPGMSGLELGQEIRRRYPDVPVVLTSGYSHVLAQNGKHGFELLHKPYSVEQLSRVLRKAIGWAKSKRATS